MATNSGTIVTAPLNTPDTNDVYPTHIGNLGKGGYHHVVTLEERDNITVERRLEGMLCSVLENETLYQLRGGIDNAFWEIFATGAGGATSASSLGYTPSGEMQGTNVQSALDELEARKADRANHYTKVETDGLLTGHTHDYSSLSNTPDLSSLHSHTNKGTLDKFEESQGELSWNGKSVGTMISDVYDTDGDGLVDKAKTLEGLIVNSNMLNYTSGLTGNIQQQINAISSGTIFKGEYDTFQDMIDAMPTPSKGAWVFIVADETRANAKTQYYHDGNEWIYGGGASSIPAATDTVTGGIKLAGALDNPNGTADNPLLNVTGVVAGPYKNANLVIEEDGRISHAEDGSSALIDDSITTETETWSSQKISDGLASKALATHTHDQLHDANMLGTVPLDVTTVSDNRVITYNAVTGKAEWKEAAGGKVYVGSKVISGDYRLVSGSYISLFIDDVAKTITINSTATTSGGGNVPTLTEITQTIELEGGEKKRLSLDAAFKKYDVRTVYLTNSEGVPMDIGIYNASTGGRRIYLSNKEIEIYDIVNVPCLDADEAGLIHIELTNYGSIKTTASLAIQTTNLI